eukprot:TRINITY_DN36671_c0_g2_i1.p1 TRINITY_DN36671_c0_g2~~TRINITY_DN36671_c0_g2_i1.p1  ORF type:complete len:104 (-),score=20.88 TRINITY_DN36671_c0_g2_i1:38-349(-)
MPAASVLQQAANGKFTPKKVLHISEQLSAEELAKAGCDMISWVKAQPTELRGKYRIELRRRKKRWQMTVILDALESFRLGKMMVSWMTLCRLRTITQTSKVES